MWRVAIRTAAATMWLAAVCLIPVAASALDRHCADVDDSGDVSVDDAFRALLTALGLDTCEACLCDVDTDGSVRTRDALAILRAAVQGVDDSLVCPPCDHGACGDGEIAAYAGASLTGTLLNLVTCEELDSGGPGAPPPYPTHLLKAFDRNLQRVDESVTVIVENTGCICHQVLVAGEAERSTVQLTTTASTTSTSLDCTDCFFAFGIQTSSEVAALEIQTGFPPYTCSVQQEIAGMRTKLSSTGSLVIRIDGGVEEECDDGNQGDDDGCSGYCSVEAPWTCHFDASSDHCEGACPDGKACVTAQDGGCRCSAHVCGQCLSTLDLSCSAACRTTADCPPNAFCGAISLGSCPEIQCPCCPECGDGECTLDESRCNCAADCGAPGATECAAANCGDGFCDPVASDESYESCPQECRLACRPC